MYWVIFHMKIGVIGLGFVGLTLAVALAYKKYNVIGVDIDEKKIEFIRSGKSPFYEEGLNELLPKVINNKLVVTTDYEMLRETDVVFIAVGTPPNPNGSQNQSYIIDAVKKLGRVWRDSKEYKVMVVKSTVIPGTTRKLAKILSEESRLKIGIDLGIAMNPEFLREGKALYDTFYPSRVVIGCIDDKTCKYVENLCREFYKKIGKIPPILTMSLEEAELVKYASNAFLAMRISFANTIANICEKTPNCDVMNVLEAVGLDPRIGKQYLRPGLGYGGSCLPKDVKALIHYSKNIGYEPILLEAVDKVNEQQPYKAIEYLLKEYGDLRGKTIAILGLAFKPGTDDIRESIAIKIIKKLLRLGAKIKAHDPMAVENTRKILGNKITYCKNPLETIKDADGAIIITEWNIYRKLDPKIFKELMRKPIIIDGRRIHEPTKFIQEKIEFYAIGLNQNDRLTTSY